MIFLEVFKFTGRVMIKRPLRSLLTILQMGLGVWIVAIILSLNLQATGSLAEVNRTLGSTLAKISLSQQEEIPGGGMMISPLATCASAISPGWKRVNTSMPLSSSRISGKRRS